MKKIYKNFSYIYKCIEFILQFRTEMCKWFVFSIRYLEKQDHSGLYFTISFLKLFYLEINIYDQRNWDKEKNCFCIIESQHVAARNMRYCQFNGFNKSFNYDDAESCLQDAEKLLEYVLQVATSWKRSDGQEGLVQKRVEEHFNEIECSLEDMIGWLKKILCR